MPPTPTPTPLATAPNASSLLDIHLGNAMLKSPSSLNSLSVEQLHEKYGRPETVAVSRVDGAPLPHNIPEKAVLPLYLGKKAHEISLPETRLILADFGEAFAPASGTRPCEDCRSPLAAITTFVFRRYLDPRHHHVEARRHEAPL